MLYIWFWISAFLLVAVAAVVSARRRLLKQELERLRGPEESEEAEAKSRAQDRVLKGLSIVLLVVLLLVFLLGVATWLFFPSGPAPDRYLLKADARDLKSTVVTPHLEQPIEPGKNVLWCSTFQLAWNEGCALIGEDIRLEGDPPVAEILNRKAATVRDIDNESCLAMAGWTPGIIESIRGALREKFNETAPELLPNLPAGWLVEYAYLSKNLEFAVPFEPIDGRLTFAGKPVKAFGVTEGKEGAERLAAQCLVLAEGDNDVVIELVTKSKGDRLILAKVAPAATLGETIAEVRRRIEASGEEPRPGSGDIIIPKLNFDVLREYKELEGRKLMAKDARFDGLPIAAALQTIRFQLNEHGAKLRSEAMMAEAAAEPVSLVFDRPFLILLERRGASAPYFALWVDNAELLVPE